MTLKRVWLPSPNYSSRGGAAVRLIVLHTTEGAMSYQSLGNYFSGPVGASSHVGIDNAVRGTIGEYVRPSDKAWTACNANPSCIQAEQCGYAAWSRDYWLNSQATLLHNTADWIAEEAARYSIPVTILTPSQAQGSGRGVCQHRDLGSWGTGHSDCGDGYPIDQVISWAKGSTTAPTPVPPPTGTKAPPFPYGTSHYIGQPSSDPHCHSGCYGGTDETNCATWQRQMASRGWAIGVDGCYGPQSATVCRQFQAEKGLAADGLVGPQTWAAAWTAPVT